MNPQRGLPEEMTEAYQRGSMHSVGYRRRVQLVVSDDELHILERRG